MAYIIVTSDDGTVVFKKYHLEYPAGFTDDGYGTTTLLNDMVNAVLRVDSYLKMLEDREPYKLPNCSCDAYIEEPCECPF